MPPLAPALQGAHHAGLPTRPRFADPVAGHIQLEQSAGPLSPHPIKNLQLWK